MINKISNLKLVLGLVLLGLIYFAVTFFDGSKSAELEKQLVSIDTSKISSISIDGPNETVNLFREGHSWQVALKSGQRVTAVNHKVNSLLNQLMDISTDRLAAKEKSKWGDYGVDSTGTHLQIQEENLVTLDMIIGQSGSTSYLRLVGETEVYASDNFKGLNNNDKINHYRDNTFVKMKTDSIESIAFNYPGDSAFQLINSSGTWSFDNGVSADSIKTASYLRTLGLKSNDNFAVQDGGAPGPQIAQIIINSKNQPPVTLTAYEDPSDSVIFQSNVNPEAFFNDKTLGDIYFLGETQFKTEE